MASETADFECWTQHPSQLIFPIRGDFLAKTGGKNQNTGQRQGVTGLNDGRAFKGKVADVIQAQQKTDAMPLTTDHSLHRRRHDWSWRMRYREFECTAGCADLVMQRFRCGDIFALVEIELREIDVQSAPSACHGSLGLAIEDFLMTGRADFGSDVVFGGRLSTQTECRETYGEQ
jgi:hypothetical protein